MRRAVLGFLAGFLSTLVFHQGALWLLHLAHKTPRMPFAMRGVPPFGVPSVISLAFWGGVWGIIMMLLIARSRGAAFWAVAIVFGAIFPTLVAAFVIAPMRGQIPPGGHARLALGLIVNGAWGLGTAVFYRLFSGGKG